MSKGDIQRLPISANLPSSSPFKGEVRRGMGSEAAEFTPIPSPTLPLKGREKCSGALKLAHMRLRGNDEANKP